MTIVQWMVFLFFQLLQGKVEKRSQLIHWAYNIRGNFDGLYKVATRGDQYKLIGNYMYGEIC